MSLSSRVTHWIHGVLAAFIGGGAGAVSAGFTAAMIDPQKFNLNDQLGNFFKMVGITFVVSGTLTTMAYLKQSPLPAESTGNTEQFIKPKDQ